MTRSWVQHQLSEGSCRLDYSKAKVLISHFSAAMPACWPMLDAQDVILSLYTQYTITYNLSDLSSERIWKMWQKSAMHHNHHSFWRNFTRRVSFIGYPFQKAIKVTWDWKCSGPVNRMAEGNIRAIESLPAQTLWCARMPTRLLEQCKVCKVKEG